MLIRFIFKLIELDIWGHRQISFRGFKVRHGGQRLDWRIRIVYYRYLNRKKEKVIKFITVKESKRW